MDVFVTPSIILRTGVVWRLILPRRVSEIVKIRIKMCSYFSGNHRLPDVNRKPRTHLQMVSTRDDDKVRRRKRKKTINAYRLVYRFISILYFYLAKRRTILLASIVYTTMRPISFPMARAKKSVSRTSSGFSVTASRNCPPFEIRLREHKIIRNI